VLPYTSDRSGLYLHGINLNTADLRTWPIEKVAKFANEWGFREVPYRVFQTLEEVKIFTDKIKEERLLDDRPIEGFVIRTKIISTGQDFFFKVKYDEPYLMYREWREITKTLLSNKKPRVTYSLSRDYLEWVKEKIKTQPNLFKEYKQNHGIFHVRDKFLEYWNDKGNAQITAKIPQEERKTLLVPVATIGCGKYFVNVGLYIYE
jgi:tRNA ligase